MSNKCNQKAAQEVSAQRYPRGQAIYQIRIQGHLSQQWATWFGDFAISLQENGETLLTGPIVDQAALYGLLRKVRDVDLPLLSVNCICSPSDQKRSVR